MAALEVICEMYAAKESSLSMHFSDFETPAARTRRMRTIGSWA